MSNGFYTDGIPKAKDLDKVMYNAQRMCEVISHNWHKSAQEIKEAVIAEVRRHIGKQNVFDDITLLVLKRQDSVAESVQDQQKVISPTVY
ncbi:SpoIIE family protein phosphatase [Microcoleus sp. MOSTC5]|uniref:SpoIIE family protein phosphatase n=1 Tax=Microcoleus sp. MOSTC5 TaxID=3055378 RepID=UPI002FD29873